MNQPRTTRLLAFARELQRATSFHELLELTKAELVATVGYETSWLGVADSEGADELRLVAFAGQRLDVAWDAFPVVKLRDAPLLQSLMTSDVPLVVPDARHEPRANDILVEKLGMRTIVFIPLRLLDLPFGVLGTGTVGDQGTRTPTAEQLDYLVGMGSQLAVAAGRIRFLAERKRAQAEKGAFESAVLESALDAIVMMNHAGTITEFNPSAERIFGYARSDAIGRPLAELIVPPDMRARHRDGLRRYLETGAPRILGRRLEIMAMRKDGSLFPAEVAVVRIASGSLPTFIGTIRDITERKQAEEALRNSEARFRRLTDSGLLGTVLSDSTGNIIEVNDAFLAIVGYTRADFTSGHLSSRSLNVPQSAATDAVPRAQLEETGMAQPWEKVLLRKDGALVPILIGVTRIEPGFNMAFVVDLTERKRAEASIRQLRAEREAEARYGEAMRVAKEAAEMAASELEAFSYSVAHDLRAPLRAMDGFSKALIEDYGEVLDGPAVGYLRRIAAGAGRMSQIIDALLSLARLPRMEVRREPVDIAKIARSVVEQLRAGDPERTVEYVGLESAIVLGDAQLLRILMDNLLHNAWKFTGRRSDARIELGQVHGELVTFFVRDNGAGFDMAFVDKLFSPFRRLHTAAEFEGTGIGLATVARIVRRHGGRVWAEAKEGEGASFYFTIGDALAADSDVSV